MLNELKSKIESKLYEVYAKASYKNLAYLSVTLIAMTDIIQNPNTSIGKIALVMVVSIAIIHAIQSMFSKS